MNAKTIERVNLNKIHCETLIELLNEYMNDKMGLAQLIKKMAPNIIAGLKSHSTIGIL